MECIPSPGPRLPGSPTPKQMETLESVTLDLPAANRYLNVLSACIGALLEHAHGLTDPALQVYNCQVAAQELATNIIAHAYSRKQGRLLLTLTLTCEPQRFVLEARDTGAAFEPAAQQTARWERSPASSLWTLVAVDPVEWSAEHGRGLWLMSELVDSVSYRRDDTLNYWRIDKELA